MVENWQQIQSHFANGYENKQAFVLATIVKTSGSTYQKVGTSILINEQGQCSGLLSGGCLEADIALHAKDVFASGLTKLLHYDLASENSILWGLGLGCEGALTILLLPINAENNYLGFDQVLACMQQGQSCYYFQQISDQQTPIASFAENEQTSEQLNNSTYICSPCYPATHLMIAGAGTDAVPIVNIAHEMGWRVSLVDHRKVLLEQSVFNNVSNKIKARANKLTAENIAFNQAPVDALVIMTHSLENDQAFLQLAVQAELNYIGLLGPEKRKHKLVKQLNFDINERDINNRLFGPVGLNLGGRSPQAIALSIIAQVQQVLAENSQLNHSKPKVINYD